MRPAFDNSTVIEARTASIAVDRSDGLTWLPAWQLRDLIARREVSSVEVVRHFLGRIEEHDSKLNAFRKLDVPGALAQAQRSDKATRAGEALGPLHGVPIAVKELLFVKGFRVHSAYFGYLSGRSDMPIATRDDIAVERLRAAGAVIVGVTVSAGGLGPENPEPASLPRNPWDLSCTSGGSSAGNGAAVAAGLVPMAIGDDGGGSVRVPAAFCGLLGLHATRGRIPHVDYKSAAPRLIVTIGPMTRSVRDAAIALQVLAGPDGRDFVCLQDQPPDYLAALDAGVSGKRFLWTDDFGFALPPEALRSAGVISAVHGATRVLRQAGGSVTNPTIAWENPVLSWLAVPQLTSGAHVPGFVEEALSETQIVAALESRKGNWQRFREVFAEYDFVISPTVPFTAPDIDTWIELWKQQGGHPKHALVCDSGLVNAMMCNVLGIPAITIPVGFVDGMPVGLQVIGRSGSEAELLQVAQACLAGFQDD